MKQKTNSQVLNVGKGMRMHTCFRVSPDAVAELLSRFDDWLVDNMQGVEKVAGKHGRKTILEEDVLEYLSFVNHDVLS